MHLQSSAGRDHTAEETVQITGNEIITSFLAECELALRIALNSAGLTHQHLHIDIGGTVQGSVTVGGRKSWDTDTLLPGNAHGQKARQ